MEMIRKSLLAFCAVAALAPSARADDARATARALFAKAQKTVVTVRLVLKMSMGGHDQEQKLEAVGTVIDPSGLTVVPTAVVDPGSIVRAMMHARPGGAEMKLDTTVTETTIILSDGTEVESDVILKDADLDLAFIRPRDQSKPLEAVTLKPGRALPQVLDEVILLGRYGRAASRAAWVEVSQVRAVVKGPRTFALCGGDAGGDALGTVAYGTDGTPVGVFVTHIGKDSGAEGSRGISGMMGGGHQGGSVILRSIDDVLEVADQARKMKNPEPKPPEAAVPAMPEKKP